MIRSPTIFTSVAFIQRTCSFVSIFCNAPTGAKVANRLRTITAFHSGGEGRKRGGMRTLVRSVSNHSEAEVFDLDVASGGNSTVM